MVSLEAIFLSTFVLIKQNRMSKRADQRAHLDLQINLLAEREMTLVLQMLQRISTRLGVRSPEGRSRSSSKRLRWKRWREELRAKLPDEYSRAPAHNGVALALSRAEEGNMLLLLIILIVLLFGTVPAWPYSRGWGYYPSGGLGLIVLVL